MVYTPADISIVLGVLGLLGGIIRYELDIRHRSRERKESLEELKTQTGILAQIERNTRSNNTIL